MSGTRYTRQVRIAEVGEVGQARLEAGEVVLGGADDAREVEATYLRLAGVQVREAHPTAKAKAKANPDEKSATSALAALGIRDRAPRDVAEGALRALVAMRTILAIEKSES